MREFIRGFREIGKQDVPSVGGKNASLGEMFNELTGAGIRVPDGFATTAEGFRVFLSENDLDESLVGLMLVIERPGYSNLTTIGSQARELIRSGEFSEQLRAEIAQAYDELGGGAEIEVAVRSSATAEDLPTASFAGQHESFLNIRGTAALLEAVKECYVSLYTDRAIKYREDKGFEHQDLAISVGIQKMVRSDKACSGVCFTIEPESGFREVLQISGVYGLGENIVQGTVNPDEFFVFKPTLAAGKNALISRKLGSKSKTMIYSEAAEQGPTLNVDTPESLQKKFVLSDQEVTLLARWAVLIEAHYGMAMDIEWAKDGLTGELFIIQARPETVHYATGATELVFYRLKERGEVLVSGDAIGSRIVTGPVKILQSAKDISRLQQGDILVTHTTSPDWDPLLKRAGAVVTDQGGRTSHAAIVARELGVPAVVGSLNGTRVLQEGEIVTVSCAEGRKGNVYRGALEYEEERIDRSGLQLPRTEAKLILADPEKAFQLSFLPNQGVGLLRMEFIITHLIQIHPMALLRFDELKDEQVRDRIEQITASYNSKAEYFIDRLSQGLAMIAAAFYPKEVIVRMSDFKTNEYANLLGGEYFEPKEENPMLGFRGAARYYSESYREGFALECGAVKKVREEMGLTNVKVMIPFCRTLEEARRVIEEMASNGLVRKENGLELLMMVEIPSNVVLIEQFAELFDGFSIGSNDLTQLVLGIDRDSQLLASHFNENDPSVRIMMENAIRGAVAAGTKIGLCGQAPSDLPDFAAFLIKAGISSISFNPDALLQGIGNMVEAEKIHGKEPEIDTVSEGSLMD